MGYCRPVAVQTMLLVDLAIKFDGGIPAGMLLTDGGTDNNFDGLGQQIWRRRPYWDAVS